MAQALSEWQQFLNWVQRELRGRWKFPSYPLPSASQLKAYRGWFFGIGMLTILLWHWKLTISLGMGGGAMFVAYSSQGWDWYRVRRSIDGLWDGGNRPFTLTIASGGVATLGTYLAIAVWTGIENHVLALGMILQGMVTLAVLALLVRAELTRRGDRRNLNFDRHLDRLTDADPLARAIAVRQILRLSQQIPLDKTQQQAISDSFRLMLRREPEPLVRNAILDGLRAIGELKTLTSGTPPISIPVTQTQKVKEQLIIGKERGIGNGE